ncbi:MAG: NAD(P)H-dependent oxidoreductase subunit E [Gammaproteobacteria bacterium]|nr:NAD(P)H-dependent oxidoreductase subunit E [Gammaproteobacteria bacterium]
MGDKVVLLTEHTRHEIDGWISRFPEGRQRSATLSALRFVQEQNNGFLTPELMDAVAQYLKLPSIQVYEAATFYSMFETHPCGRHHVSVCTNISCWLNGGEEILAYCERKLSIKAGESTPDKRIFLKQEEECLAACTGAPMMMVDHIFYEYLTPAKVDKILDDLK